MAEDTLVGEEEKLGERKLMFLEVMEDTLLRPLNREDLHWLWQVEQVRTIRLVAALLLLAFHRMIVSL